jgi:hypothetical protein
MALTHDHINAYVIVGGDSDFLSLVEKLKQYDKTVIVVGGRAFTSVILQRNCHEFIAYENLVNVSRSDRRQPERGRPSGTQSVTAAFPLVRRAMKVLSEREVTPQLGLLKSTLLQLDSTFSEKSYGAGSFRDFAEKLAQAGLIRLNQSGRNLLVDIKDEEPGPTDEGHDAQPAAVVQPTDRQHHDRHRRGRHGQRGGGAPPQEREAEPEDQPAVEAVAAAPEASRAPAPGEALAVQQAEAIAMLRRVIENATMPLRWPMYVRNVKQLLRAADSAFDERRYGFGGILDLLRASQRDGVLRLERDRQGVLRVFQGAALQRPVTAPPVQDARTEEAGAPPEAVADEQAVLVAEAGQALVETADAGAQPVIDGETVDAAGAAAPAEGEAAAEATADAKPKRKRAPAGAKKPAAPKKLRAAPARPRGKKKE